MSTSGPSPNRAEHWQGIYDAREEHEVGWFQETPARALKLIEAAGLPSDAAIIDVGGGASRLVDNLLDRGFTDLTVLDFTDAGIEKARQRLGDRQGLVTWLIADVTTWRPERPYDLWHDRAVIHFLTEAADRAAYLSTLRAAVPPGGQVIISSFAEDGPEMCSGLPVVRYGVEAMAAAFAGLLTLQESERETHHMPSGTAQNWRYFRFLRDDD
ncbi:MAG: class I SAM-dependent methyltransferase [Alphaproteobacteria bacterium]|jgi:SAM-dependent methyltransferase|nr:class I SAM-dependent methyltransferase [Alphaproteobacteria bacterium]MDP6812225.1 class I SAM-dependent methyltransferase [Alphaproteobacteria bacterium]